MRLAFMAALALAASTVVQAGQTRTYTGKPVPVGNGEAGVLVTASSTGTPLSVSVVLSRTALEGLPGPDPKRETWEYVLAMPPGAPQTGYDHVGLNWNPAGHPPAGIYTVPHFDVHFYLISRAEQEAITFQGTAAKPFLPLPKKALIPKGYVVPPNAAVEKMGYHGIDTWSHEFHGKPFDHTFIYGYSSGRLTFVEPMVTLAFLKTKPNMSAAVRTPHVYSISADYPTRYRIGFDADRKEYSVSLLGLKSFTPMAR